MMKIENDFISSEFNFKCKRSNPKHNISISLSKQKLEDNTESFWITTWGKWGDTEHQHDLSFKSKKECVSFLTEMIKVIKTDYPTEAMK